MKIWVWLAVMLVASSAHAEDITRSQRNALLKEGAVGVAGAAVVGGVLAGLGAMLTSNRCYESTDEDGDSFTWCGTGQGPLLGAALGGMLGYELTSWVSIPDGYRRRGQALGLRGHTRMVRSTVVASSLATLTLTWWAIEQARERGLAVSVPIGIAGGIASIVAPWGLGYLAYRGSHRRKRGPVVQPLLAPTMVGVRGRF